MERYCDQDFCLEEIVSKNPSDAIEHENLVLI